MEFSTETGDARSGTLMLHLLGRCNLTCLHCYMEGAPARSEYLPLEYVLQAVGECQQLGIASLYLTGGEPLLYPGLEQVLRLAADIPGLDITVCTNATLLKEHHAVFLREAGARVNISVDGNEEFHDYFRNKSGSFRLTERGLRNVTEAGIDTTIVATISQANLHLLPWMAEWAAKAGVRQFRVQPLLHLGRGNDIADQCLSRNEMNRLLLQLTDLANAYRSRGMKCNLVGASRSFLRKHPCGAYVCNGGGCHRRVAQEIKKLVVREDGTILPEVTNLSHDFAIGQLGQGSLVGMVDRYFRNGYERFDSLCRTTYAEVLPQWDSEFIPWDEIVAARSHRQLDAKLVTIMQAGCGTCGDAVADECTRA